MTSEEYDKQLELAKKKNASKNTSAEDAQAFLNVIERNRARLDNFKKKEKELLEEKDFLMKVDSMINNVPVLQPAFQLNQQELLLDAHDIKEIQASKLENENSMLVDLNIAPQVFLSNQQLKDARMQEINSNELDELQRILAHDESRGSLDVIEKYNIAMTSNSTSMKCLNPLTLINDEVINFSMCMLSERDKRLYSTYSEFNSNHNHRKSFYMTSYFYHRLLQAPGVIWTGKPADQPEVYNYDNVKNYTKTIKGGITNLERIYFPIHVKGGIGHWLLIVVYMLKKEVHFYDSCAEYL
jgi:Ulp1 family protease